MIDHVEQGLTQEVAIKCKGADKNQCKALVCIRFYWNTLVQSKPTTRHVQKAIHLPRSYTRQRIIKIVTCLFVLAGCGTSTPPTPPATELDCMARAMYFESNRSSRDGMIAVGSVVMNRVQSDAFPDTICGVVSQRNQFAPGVMTKEMNSRSAPLVRAAAQSVYAGERHPNIAAAKFFHAAWYRASYRNMHYVLTTGGNAFYEKRRRQNVTMRSPVPATEGITRGLTPIRVRTGLSD